MSRMGARWGRNLTGVCPSAALDSLPPSEPRAPFPATAVGATSVAVAFPRFYCPRRRLTERADPLGHSSGQFTSTGVFSAWPVVQGISVCTTCTHTHTAPGWGADAKNFH